MYGTTVKISSIVPLWHETSVTEIKTVHKSKNIAQSDATNKHSTRRFIAEFSRSHTIRPPKKTQTHKTGRAPLNERSPRRRGHYLHNTQQTQQT